MTTKMHTQCGSVVERKLEIERSLVRVSLETQFCAIEHDPLYSAKYWFNQGNVPT